MTTDTKLSAEDMEENGLAEREMKWASEERGVFLPLRTCPLKNGIALHGRGPTDDAEGNYCHKKCAWSRTVQNETNPRCAFVLMAQATGGDVEGTLAMKLDNISVDLERICTAIEGRKP
jgi:hypothetical protein